MPLDDDTFDFSNIAATLAALSGSISLKRVLEESPELIKTLQRVHPVKTAATFGALLTQKRLQPNCLRLEVLVHLCVALGQKSSSPTSQLLIQGYAAVGKAYGHMEDPPEDIFVGNIYSRRGNYRVLEGIWESGTFYLQRFVNMVDAFGENDSLLQVADSIHALLKLSELVCERANLVANEIGGNVGESILPGRIANRSSELRKLVSFSFEELERLGIKQESLQPFIFNPSLRHDLLQQSISNTDLEAHPLAVDGNQLYLLLPTAISVAIRRYFISVLASGENRKIFLRNLAREYSKFFSQIPFFGKGIVNVSFTHRPWGSVCSLHTEIDTGRYLILTFFMDTLEDFGETGFGDAFSGNNELAENMTWAISKTQEEISKETGFKDGIAFIIGCGVGRGVILPELILPAENWHIEFLSAADYGTLSKADGMEPLNLWRLIQMRRRLEGMGVRLQNMNGFLNLYAWADSLDGHLVPHADIPNDIQIQDKTLHIGIRQNALLELRQEVAKSTDSHSEKFVDGTWREVFTEGRNSFAEDDKQPLYVSFPTEERQRPLGAHISSKRCWWYELRSPIDGPDTTSHDRWRTLDVWLQRAIMPLERAFSRKLGSGPILWRCIFLAPRAYVSEAEEEHGSELDASESIEISVDTASRTVTLTIGPRFDRALLHVENVAERALVAAFVRGVSRLAEDESVSVETIIQEIVPNIQARHSHAFYMRGFRDRIRDLHAAEPIVISRFDGAASKLGLGWRVRRQEDGALISGKAECMAFLNSLVRNLEDDLCLQLRRFNKEALLSKLLLNHEIGCASRERWHRTAAAVLGLRTDKAATLEVMRDHEFKLNAVFQAGRNLMEIALCESLLEKGDVPGDLDISRLLASAAELFHIGGWSDLIFWEMMEPTLIVRPLGDVHANLDFLDTVLDSFGSATSEYRYMHSVKGYSKNLEQLGVDPEISGKLDEQFVKAWIEDFGVDIDAYRRFLDAVENAAVEEQTAILKISRSDLINLAETPELGEKIVESLTLASRTTWRDLPEGYGEKDIASWKFRRRLSVLRRPLLQLNDERDPSMLFAPGLLREGFIYMFMNYLNGSYQDIHLGPAMRRYAGYVRKKDGLQFNCEVAKRMPELGWQVALEINVTKILGKSLDKNYGDVDVLAWDMSSGRVLIMECKDLQLRKTYGEIAEQLSDFKGAVTADGKRDLLRKHLDRVQVLREYSSQVKKYLGITGNCAIESHIVFRHPVPMLFADGLIREQVNLHVFSDLEKSLRNSLKT